MFFDKKSFEELKSINSKLDKILVRQKNNSVKSFSRKKDIEEKIDSLSLTLMAFLLSENAFDEEVNKNV